MDFLKIIEIVNRAQNGLKLDQIWIDGKEVPITSGTLTKGSGTSLTIDCKYQRPGEPEHHINAHSIKGPDNNTLKIDDKEKQVVKIKIDPDFDFGFPPSLELRVTIMFKDDAAGASRVIVLSTEKIV